MADTVDVNFNDTNDYSIDKILETIEDGFYVMDIIGLHSGVNPVSGQISVGAKGMWCKDKELVYPIHEVTIATDILTLCKSLIKVGKDLQFFPFGGYVGCPLLVFKDIAIGGK